MRIVYLTLVCLIITSCAHKTIIIEKPLYWQAKKGDRVIKLFGTIHLHNDIITPPEQVIQDILKTEILYVESSKGNNAKFSQEVKAYVKKMFSEMLIPYPDYFSKLSPTARNNINYMMKHPKTASWLKENKIQANIDQDPVTPALIYFVFMNFAAKQDEDNQVVGRMMLQELIYTASLSRKFRIESKNSKIMDVILEEHALKNNIPTKSLDQEVTFYQIMDNLPDFLVKFDSNPQELAIKIVEDIFGDQEKIREDFSQMDQLLDLYIAADQEAINSLASEADKNNKNLLLKERNASWKNILIEDTTHKNIAVAVGALHLVGEDSLLELLEKEGYSIQRL